jgi:anti-anti-sigma factor
MSAIEANQECLAVTSEQIDHAVHLHLRGDLDMVSSPVLENWLSTADRIGIKEIVVNLEHVTFMDTSGLHAFLRASERAGRSGRELAIVKPITSVRRVFELTDTTHLFGSHQSESVIEPDERILGVAPLGRTGRVGRESKTSRPGWLSGGGPL